MSFASARLQDLARILGLDTRSESFSYARDARFGAIARAKVPERWVKTTCGYCSVGCGILVGVKGGRAVSVAGDPEHPVNEGKLCPKGLCEHEAIHAPGRALHPLRRAWAGLRRVGWDEALELFVSRVRALQEAHGKESFAVLSTGQLVTEELYALGKLVRLGIGAKHYDGNTTLCMASAVSGYKRSFGTDGPPGCYEDLELADVVVLIGANIADNHPILAYRLFERRGRDRPPRVIAIDPRATKTAMHADHFLAVRPRSDIYLLNGLAHLIIREGWVDQEFVRRHTAGYEALAGHLERFTPRYVSQVTRVPEEEIREAARLIGTAKSTFFAWTMGVNHSTQGTETVNCITNLALLTGNVGRAGGAPFSITGQCNAMGSREASSTSSLPGYRRFESEKDRTELARLWGVNEELVPRERGFAYPDIIDAVLAGTVKGLWIVATNPLVSYPDQEKVRRALAKLEFLAVQDGFHPTPTTEIADLVLPAAIWGEKEGTFTNSERRVSRVRAAVDPPGEARSDFQIIVDIAERLGVREALFPDWRTPRDAFEEWRRVSKGRPCDYSGLTYELLEESSVQWPAPEEAPGGRARLYEDGSFPTEDGRARLFVVNSELPPEEPDSEFPFLLNTGRTVEHWHTRTKTGKIPLLDRKAPEAWIEIHPRDARRLGVRNHDWVSVRSRRGAVERVRARTTAIVAPGQVFMPFHYAECCANNLTLDRACPISREPNFKQCAVRIEKARAT